MIRGGQRQQKSTPRPAGQEVLCLPVAKSTKSPSPCATALQMEGRTGQPAPGDCPPASPLPKAPFRLFMWGSVQRREGEANHDAVTTALLLPGCPSLPLETPK